MKAIERLYKYIDFKGYRPTSFEKEIGLSSGYLSVQKKRNADIGETVINKINDYCHDINIEWLLTGNGEMLRNQKEQKLHLHPTGVDGENVDSQDKYTDNIEDTQEAGVINFEKYSVSQFKQRGYAPYYSLLKVSAGQYDLATIEQSEEPDSWIKFPEMKIDAWFPIVGFSMEPKIFAGDTIGVVAVNNWERIDPDKIYMIVTIYDRMIKHLEIDEANTEYLWAVSENHPKFKIYTHEIVQIYKVVFAGRLV